MSYQIREVDDEEETLAELHKATFPDTSAPDFNHGHWWLAFDRSEPIAFAGVMESPLVCGAGYFNRVGVLAEYRGHGLQLKLMRSIERRARANGWQLILSDTTDNIPSANNFIRAGYHLYEPAHPWAFKHSLYWRKAL